VSTAKGEPALRDDVGSHELANGLRMIEAAEGSSLSKSEQSSL
jgi:hypothetical protein